MFHFVATTNSLVLKWLRFIVVGEVRVMVVGEWVASVCHCIFNNNDNDFISIALFHVNMLNCAEQCQHTHT